MEDIKNYIKLIIELEAEAQETNLKEIKKLIDIVNNDDCLKTYLKDNEYVDLDMVNEIINSKKGGDND
ncbi:hypothetical protein L7E35_004680 [Vibrio parahaemolyticus]|nr:hypothetical protein [Vibrio parahaemolyticus]EIV1599734.1 hypothetical protein [Vibrio parahaemolyticus]